MDPFSSSYTSSGLSSPSSSSSGPSAEALMDQVKVQLAQACAEEFIEHGSSLSESKSSYIYRCIEHDIEAIDIIGQALFSSTY
ncbi:unnamed protein product [Spirodela intermedia]|uniref:Uncharacterized protein n=1 Tax=Spirodela intermedia TaxID=51605 RepID=A0A7I8K517_SPIIN|nr:unnamed protein product [Spirodela intermedia]